MKKTMKVIASVHLTDTPVTHILEVFTRLQNSYNIELIALNTPDMSKVTDLTRTVNIRQAPLTQYNIPLLKGFFYEAYIILYILSSREKIDFIYSRSRPFNFAEYVIGKLKKIPIVIEVNGILTDEIIMETPNPSSLTSLRVKMVSFIEKKSLSAASKIITVTSNIKKRIQKDYHIREDKITVIGNGANTTMFKPVDKKEAKKKLNLDENQKYITFTGNLAPWQGIEFLVKAAPLILKEIPDIKFLIVGDGSVKEKLMGMVDDLDLHDSFIFTGMVPYEDVPLYINSGELCVAYKIPIGSGYSALKFYEYMACGMPIVGSRVTGFEILEEHDAGILVEPQNHEKLADAVIKLLKNDELREQMGKNGRKYLVENSSWDAVTKKIENILKDIPGV